MKRSALMGIISATVIVLFLVPTRADDPAPEATPTATPVVKHYRKIKKKKKAVVPKASSVSTVPSASAGSVPATSAPKTSLQVWLSRLKKKIARSETSHSKLVAVAAVRGAEAADAPPLYWKGKSAEGPVDMPELKEFDEALDSAVGGDSITAKTKLQNFIMAHPTSPLAGDAKQTLDMLGDNAKP